MNTSKHIAKHFKEVYFGGNWTCSNLKDQLKDISWKEATLKTNGLNSIVTLVYHIHYYVTTVSSVLEGKPLHAKDELSFNHPPIQSKQDWTSFLDSIWKEAEAFIISIENLPDQKLEQPFTNIKYGNYYRNLNGIIEHCHYHLGQISLIKKIIKDNA